MSARRASAVPSQTHLCNLCSQSRSVVPPLLVIVLCVSEFAFNLLVPLLFLEESESRLVFFARPFRQSLLRVSLRAGGFFLQSGESLEFLDGSLDGHRFRFAFILDDPGEPLGVFAFCKKGSAMVTRPKDDSPIPVRRRRVCSSKIRSDNSARV